MSYLHGLVIFPTFFNLSLNFSYKEFMIWAIVSSQSCFYWLESVFIFGCKEYNQSDFSVDHLVMSMCRFFSCVVGRGCLLWPVHYLGKTLLVFALLHSVFQGQICLTPGVCWLPTFAFQSLIMKRTSFWGVSLKGLVGLHRTIQLQPLQHYWLGHRLGLLWFWMVCLRNEQKSFCRFLRLHPSTAFRTLLLTMMATLFLLRDSCSKLCSPKMLTVLYLCFMKYSVRCVPVQTAVASFNLSCQYIYTHALVFGASQMVLVEKNPPADAGDIRDTGLIPGWRRSPGGVHGTPLQCSCLENPMDREAWSAAVYRVAKSRTQLKWLSVLCFSYE